MGGWRARRLGLAAALALVALAAGCLGVGGDEEALDQTQAEADDPTQREAANASAEARLAFEAPSQTARISQTGTFTTGDGAFAGGSLRGADTREHDLTPEVPTGVPVTVNVTIEYSGETTQLNGEWLFENVEVYDTHYVKSFEQDTIWMEASLARTGNVGSVVALVQADTSGESPEQEYTLEATITAHGDATLAGVPTAVPVTETSGGFALEAAEGASLGAVNVWGPSGEREQLEPRSGVVSRPVGADAAGTYTVLVTPGGETTGVAASSIAVRPVNASNPPQAPLDVVPTETTQGSWNTVSSGEDVSWTFEQAQAPVQAGLVARPAGPMATTGPGSLDVQLASPAATVIESSVAGVYGGGVELSWTSELADGDLVTGTYEGQASLDEGGTDWEVAHVVRELHSP